MTPEDPANEWQRLAMASTIVDAVKPYVDDFAQLGADEQSGWLKRLEIPDGWRIAQLEGSDAAPARIAVCGARSDGGWDGSETISVFGFTGIPPIAVVYSNIDCTLRDLDATDITIQVLTAPPTPGVVAVRASGYFSTAGLRVWAQYSTYIAGSEQLGAGRLIAHCVFVESGCQTKLAKAVTRLSDSVHQGFIASIGVVSGDGGVSRRWLPIEPGFQQRGQSAQTHEIQMSPRPLPSRAQPSDEGRPTGSG